MSIEDALFGACIVPIGVFSFEILSNKNRKPMVSSTKMKPVKMRFLLLLATVLLTVGKQLEINSIFTSYLIFLGFTLFIVFQRKDLIFCALASGTLLTMLSFVIYFPLYNLALPDFWKNSWLLQGTRFGVYVFGNIPLTELIWFFTFGSFAGVQSAYRHSFYLSK